MCTSDITKFVKKLESFCECTICFSIYDENAHVPRMLPCNHTFCTDCLLKHSSHKKIICPLCNQAYAIKNKDILIFPKDNTRREMRDLVITFASETLCNDCQIYESIFAFCINCNIRLCYTCSEKRKKNACQNHKFDCKSDTPNDSTGRNTDLTDICLLDGHEKNELKFFCKNETCHKPVCANCIVQFHIDHSFTNVNNECETRRKKMYEKCQHIKSKTEKARKILMKIKKLRSVITIKETNGREKLAATIRKGIHSLKEYEQKESERMTDQLISRFNDVVKSPFHLEEFIRLEVNAVNLGRRNEYNRVLGFYTLQNTLGTETCMYFENRIMQDKIMEDLKFLSECKAKEKKITDKTIYNLSILGRSSYFFQMLSDKKTFARSIREEIRSLLDYEINANKKTSDKLTCNVTRLKKSRDLLQNFIDNALECCSISELSITAGNISFLSTENSLAQKLDSFIEINIDEFIGDFPTSQEFDMQEEIKYVQSKISQIVEAEVFGEDKSCKKQNTIETVFAIVIIVLFMYIIIMYIIYIYTLSIW